MVLSFGFFVHFLRAVTQHFDTAYAIVYCVYLGNFISSVKMQSITGFSRYNPSRHGLTSSSLPQSVERVYDDYSDPATFSSNGCRNNARGVGITS